jgi:hypothetical protein
MLSLEQPEGIAERLVNHQLISPQQYSLCLFQQGESNVRPEEFCMLQGWATMDQIFEVLPTTFIPLGQVLLLYDLIRLDQLMWAIRAQQHQPLKLGQLLVHKHWIDPEILDIYLTEQAELHTLQAANSWETICQRKHPYRQETLEKLQKARQTIEAQAQTINSLQLNLHQKSQPQSPTSGSISSKSAQKNQFLLTELIKGGLLTKSQARHIYQMTVKQTIGIGQILNKYGISPQSLHFFASRNHRELVRDKGDFLLFVGASGLLSGQVLSTLPQGSLQDTATALYSRKLLPLTTIKYLIREFHKPALPGT